VYVAVYRMGRPAWIEVGRLGRFRFERGWWLYVGSAQRAMDARLARHARPDKPMRWHVDYLSVRATMVGAIVIDAGKDRECRLAGELAGRYEAPIAGFGSSDCSCRSHLFHAPKLP
jgi:sugar fermentation stimulation protein A